VSTLVRIVTILFSRHSTTNCLPRTLPESCILDAATGVTLQVSQAPEGYK
jgi:hypothetical protein